MAKPIASLYHKLSKLYWKIKKPTTLGIRAMIFDEKKEKVLLVKHTYIDGWFFPGGALEPGETLEETAARELKEETNLHAESFSLLNVFSGKDFYYKYPNEDETYSVVVLYLANGVAGELKISDGESRELAYFGKDELPLLERRAKIIIEWLIDNKVLVK